MMITKNVLLLCTLMGFAAMAQAKDGEADMTFRGTLIEPPPCTINDGNQVDVDFGERVGINKVNGVNYRQPLNYQIVCEKSAASSLALTLSLSGAQTGFDNEALLSSKENLGIRVYQNDQPFTPGSSLAIDLSSPPRLEAVPVKNAGSTLTEGAFEAWATLRADYQ
ncbi:fimbrial protein [Winslowiella toletana]|uniref:fimbrial protein n=1 Tax=Winslowiella toletana TaxID=92490 RepID=UPI0028BF1C87|nr:fimbrial protein [Winslowiella toletana]WNN46702.1 fimbrial protein [Winslowiella toletana]